MLMETVKLQRERVLAPLLAVVLLVGLGADWVRAQDQTAPPSQNQEQKQDQNQKQSDKGVRPTPAEQIPNQHQKAGEDAGATSTDAGATKPLPPKEEVKITPRQAEELFHSVDEILAFDSKRTGLPIKKSVKRRLTSRDEVVGYLTKHMKDEDVKRLQSSELV